ncbi:ubiquinol-cytochrome c reductase iron-sulfur subunit [Rhodopila globiformis]|uniref:Ubiquinol-cytochrome c reductase iron-sulfur subunit n=1 Tax=Rhodopila globiformis TaxID=1071 RepID=A0A2S6MW51_RHOGL|nr:ubiquinol-cytochrome c reductase iron-sulfur subunit [Rhodopila globiformis]PPQ26594.1 ubiquinol-cytochrome c reductase iron-sulfur subunit [Rhodopila globiformis]
MSAAAPPIQSAIDSSRRDILGLTALAGAAIGIGAVAWPFIDSMNPSKDTLAAGVPIDVDLSKIQEGQQIIVMWRGTPIFLMRRSKAALARLQDPVQLARLRDANSQVHQQPSYAMNWHRSVKEEFAVLVAICTHLGCVPSLVSKPDPAEPIENWPGGYFCHCHGSKYDLAGRVFQAVPAPYNLPVPPYHFVADETVRIGENPPNVDFELGSVVQI